MDRTTFLTNFKDQFEETDVKEISFETRFHDLDEWSSLIGMCIIAMVKMEYNKSISGEELKFCNTIEDVYNLILKK